MKKRDERHRTFHDFQLLLMAICSLMFFAAADCRAAGPADSYPSSPIEFVVHTAAGGSSDAFGRIVSDIIQREKLLNQPTVVVNKPGGSGATAFGYLYGKKGDPYTVLIVASPFIATPLLQKLPYNYKSFTPIANLGSDGSVLVVRGDSPYKTIDDLIAAARKKPKDLIQGGAALSGFESLMGQSIQKATGVQWNFISFKSGGEVMAGLLSGSVDFIFCGPAEIRQHVRTGKMRPLLAGAPKRYPELKDVPTMEEKGMGTPVASNRGLAGPPDMPDYAVKKLATALKKVYESERFQKYLEETAMLPLWLDPPQYLKFMDEETGRLRSLLSEMGLLKN